MLVLTRKVDEEIHVGEEIRIVIVEVRNGKVRLGVEAPQEYRIQRAEKKDESEQR